MVRSFVEIDVRGRGKLKKPVSRVSDAHATRRPTRLFGSYTTHKSHVLRNPSNALAIAFRSVTFLPSKDRSTSVVPV